MEPGTFDLELYRGDSYAWLVKLWEDDAMTVPFDLTDADVAAQIRDKPDGSKVVNLDCEVELPNFVNITMSPSMYTNCPSKGGWDLQVTLPDGQVQTPLAGEVLVTSDYTET